MFTKSVLVQALLVASALAAPSVAQRSAESSERRWLGSSNWAGAVLSSTEGTYSYATGTFTVPTVSIPTDGIGPFHGATAFVGIDGYNCRSGMLLGGVTMITMDPRPEDNEYYVFAQWFPQIEDRINEVPVSAGDVMRLSVNATSTTAGSVLVENLTTGKSATRSVGAQSGQDLCQNSAQWVVRDYEIVNTLPVPIANWTDVAFENVSAATTDGTVVPPNGPDSSLVNIIFAGELQSKASAGDDNVDVLYVAQA